MSTAPMDDLDETEFQAIKTDKLTDAILSTFECQGLTHGMAVYVSTPITSGEAILQWHQRVAAGTETRTGSRHLELVQENIARAEPLIKKVRQRFASWIVVEPTRLLDIPGYSQPDYHKLWSAFIERYTSIVVFNDAWELSTGCAVEFATSVLTDKEVLDARFDPLTPGEGFRSLKRATSRLQSAGRPIDVHRRVVSVLRDHIGE